MPGNNDRRPFSPRKVGALPSEVYCAEGAAFFLTTRALPGLRPFISPDRCRTVIRVLAEQRTAVGCWVGRYCLMPDHLHLIAGPGASGISVWTLIHRLHGASTNEFWKLGWQGKLWQPRGFDVLIRGARGLKEAVEYIDANPVRAGLVEAPEDWPWTGCLDDLEGRPIQEWRDL